MRLSASKITVVLLVVLCLFACACAQSEADTRRRSEHYEKRAALLREQGKLEEALQEQIKAVNLDEKNVKSLSLLASLYIEIGLKENSKEDFEKAKPIIRRAIELNQSDPILHNMLALIHNQLGEFEEALKETRISAELQPENIQAQTNLASAQNDVGDSSSAQSTFEKILLKNPNYAYALYHYAEFELERGNRAKALELFERGSKTSAADNNGETKYIEICQKRLEEVKPEKAKPASAK